jgi:PBS lyase HEAT-like repeat
MNFNFYFFSKIVNRRVIATIILQYFCGIGFAEQAIPIKISFAFQSRAVTLHEPVFLDVSINNGFTEDIKTDLGTNRMSKFAFSIVDPIGNKGSVLKLNEEGFGRVGIISIGSGHTYNQRLLLNVWYPFVEPGKYVVMPQLDFTFKTNTDAIMEPRYKESLTLEVLPRNEARLKTICQELSDKIIDSHHHVPERLDAALTLSHVVDPVAIPYLGRVLSTTAPYLATFRRMAIQGLERIGNRDAVNAIIANLKNRDPETESMAEYALYNIKKKTSDDDLRALISDSIKKP